MANTRIQIKRSTGTSTPANGSLTAAEQAYSFLSNRLFIGDSAGTGVVEIGGKYWVDRTDLSYTQANNAFATGNASFLQANAAYGHANSSYGHANAGFTTANASFLQANAAYGHANAGFTTANASFLQANAAYDHANSGFTTANAAFLQANGAYTTANAALPKAGGTVTGDLVVGGNLTISGTTTYVNTTTLNVGDNLISLNADILSNVAPSENAGIEVIRGNANTVSLYWNESTDKWSFIDADNIMYSIASNTDIANVVSSIATSSSSMNASNLTSGTVPTGRLSGSYADITGVGTLTVGTWNANTITVPYGGTGQTSFTTNGMIYGNGTGALNITAAGTDGQVLQASSSGVPQFAMLDGGTF
jgi:hypothetical protein